MHDGFLVSNDSVVPAIRFILAEEFVCHGYSKTSDELRENGFVINYKKRYRLMKNTGAVRSCDPPGGRYCYGKTPMETFEQSLILATEKIIRRIDSTSRQHIS